MEQASALDHGRRRLLLANIASRGILGHNSAVEMPQRFSLSRLIEVLPEYDQDLLEEDLAVLVEGELLKTYNTSHSGYGNTWVEGHDVWYITTEGLIFLWTEAA